LGLHSFRSMRRMEASLRKVSAVIEALPILGQSLASPEPSESSFNDPAFRQDDEVLCLIRALHDLDAYGSGQPTVRLGNPLLDIPHRRRASGRKGERPNKVPMRSTPPSRSCISAACTMARIKRQALRVGEDVALFAPDLLPRIIAMRIDGRPLCRRFPHSELAQVMTPLQKNQAASRDHK
jgi:hypothetical protein